MKTLVFLLLCPTLGGEPPKPSKTPLNLGGITLFTGPLNYTTSLRGGIEATGDVEAYGGTGTVEMKTGLVSKRSVLVTLKDANVADVAVLLGDVLPAALKPKLVGRIGLVKLAVNGDDLDLKASGFRIPSDPVQRIELTADLKTRKFKAKLYILGGLAEVEGTIPESK